jgi:hypothetical protein
VKDGRCGHERAGNWEQPRQLTGSSTHRKYTVRDIHTGRDGDGGGRQAGAGGRDDNRRRLLAGTKGHHCTVTWTWQTSETTERVHHTGSFVLPNGSGSKGHQDARHTQKSL